MKIFDRVMDVIFMVGVVVASVLLVWILGPLRG